MKILVLNGPNLNMLGIREPDIYGTKTLDDINNMIKEYTDAKGIDVEFYQSNSEGSLIDKIHSSYNNVDGIVFNPAAYTHYSIAIADAVKAVKIPTVEVHLSKISEREEFRHTSVIASSCIGQISGYGDKSYILGIDELIAYLNKEHNND